MNNITSLTRRDIFELLSKGYKEPYDTFLDIDGTTHSFPFYGRLNLVEFLSRLYTLKEMVSTDSRYENAYLDIWVHTITNPNDWEDDWLFKDDRFPLKAGTDEQLLDFLCEVFHPEVRDENSEWPFFYKKINSSLRADGYELYLAEVMSGRPLYGWRRESDKYHKLTRDEIKNFCSLFNNGFNLIDFYKNADFDAFTRNIIGLPLCCHYGLSKHQSLMSYVEESGEDNVIRLLLALFHRYANVRNDNKENVGYDEDLYNQCKIVADRLQTQPTVIEDTAKELKAEFSSEYMTRQIDLMFGMQSENPTEAIGKAKELIESCCQTILQERNVEIPKTAPLNQLVGIVVKNLKIAPENIDDKIPAAKAMKSILGSLRSIAQGIAELRNDYGSGHGKPASFQGLQERHAKLAVGSATTLVTFLWESHKRKGS